MPATKLTFFENLGFCPKNFVERSLSTADCPFFVLRIYFVRFSPVGAVPPRFISLPLSLVKANIKRLELVWIEDSGLSFEKDSL